MLPVEGSPIPVGPRYLTSPPRYVTYDPDPLPSELSPGVQALRSFGWQALAWTGVAVLMGVTMYVIGRYRGVL